MQHKSFAKDSNVALVNESDSVSRHREKFAEQQKSLAKISDVVLVNERDSRWPHGEGETPGPIPNPAVKPFCADGTRSAKAWKSRSLPGLY